jgi:O-antigen ligase
MAIAFVHSEAAPARTRPSGVLEGEANGGWASDYSAARLLILTALFLSTLAFGAVQAWAWGGLAVLAALALSLWSWGWQRVGILRVVWTPLYVPAAVFFLLGLIQFLTSRTADPVATRESLVKLATDLIIFFLAVQLWTTSSAGSAHRFALAVVGFTCLLALFSICQFFASPGTIYGLVKPRWGGWIFGPYVNHNHYAGLMEILIPISLGYLGSLWAKPTHHGRALAGFAVVVAVVSVLLSGSRGGLVGLGSELLLLTLLLCRRPGGRRVSLAVTGLVGIALTALLFFWLDPGQIAKRLGSIAEVSRAPEATLGERSALVRDSLRILRDHPWLGTGLGSFATVYPRYRSFPSDLEWDHAHNDFAEALVESGIAGAVLILSAVGLFIFLAFRQLDHRLVFSAGWISLGAAIGCCGLLVHGLADFNLHIPANAAWFSFALGLAVGPALLRVTSPNAD